MPIELPGTRPHIATMDQKTPKAAYGAGKRGQTETASAHNRRLERASVLVKAARTDDGRTARSGLVDLTQADPVAAFLRKTRGRLGKDHTLEY